MGKKVEQLIAKLSQKYPDYSFELDPPDGPKGDGSSCMLKASKSDDPGTTLQTIVCNNGLILYQDGKFDEMVEHLSNDLFNT